jgi:hypothetical protein
MEFVGLSQDKYGHVAPLYQLNGRFYRENPGKNPLNTFKKFFAAKSSVFLKELEPAMKTTYEGEKQDFLKDKKIEDMGIVESTHVMLFKPSATFWPKLEQAFETNLFYPDQLGKVPNLTSALQFGIKDSKIRYDMTITMEQFDVVLKTVRASHKIVQLLKDSAEMVKNWGEMEIKNKILHIAESLPDKSIVNERSAQELVLTVTKHPYESLLLIEVDGLGTFKILSSAIAAKSNPELPAAEPTGGEIRERELNKYVKAMQDAAKVYSKYFQTLEDHVDSHGIPRTRILSFCAKAEWLHRFKATFPFDAIFLDKDPAFIQEGTLISNYKFEYLEGIYKMFLELEKIGGKPIIEVTIGFNTNYPIIIDAKDYGTFYLAPRVEEN